MKLAKITLVELKEVINVLLAQCILCYLGYLLQLKDLRLKIYFYIVRIGSYFAYFHGCLKKIFTRETTTN